MIQTILDLNLTREIESIVTSRVLNAPFTLVILSGIIVGFVRRSWSKKDKKDEEERARKASLRKEQIIFLNEIGTTLHNFYPYLFQEIDNCDFKLNKKSKLNEARLDLFKTRFSVFVKSKAYLKDDEFANKIDDIIYDLDKMVSILSGEIMTNNEDLNYLFLAQETLKKIDKLLQFSPLKINKYIEKERILLDNINTIKVKIKSQEKISKKDFSDLMYYHASCVWLRSRELLEEAINKYILDA